jgi:hypothetical protein
VVASMVTLGDEPNAAQQTRACRPDHTRRTRASGIVEIALPSGVRFACPVFNATRLLPTHLYPENRTRLIGRYFGENPGG